MDIIQDKSLKNIMTTEVKSVSPNCIGSEIAELFESNNFHHVPVVSDENEVVGIISASDYHQLQHHFTRLKLPQSEIENEKLFRSILASEVMTPKPVCLDEDETVGTAVDIFVKNRIRAIIILREGQLAGIVTPIDILKTVVAPALINK